MNYDKLYYSIIERAIKEERKALRYKGDGNYYESHHIIPQSFGGSNNENNLVKLTAREHFLVHWILVKRFEINSDERIKMLFAFNRMCYSKPSKNSERKLNAHAFEKYRLEYIQNISKQMSEIQKGENNSQYGKHWYTDLETGKTKKAYESPYRLYVLGKDWFNSTSNKLYKIKNKKKKYVNFDENYLKLSYKEKRKYREKIQKELTLNKKISLYKKLWDEFHNSNYKNFKEFIKNEHKELNYNSMSDGFKNLLPIYKKLLNGRYKMILKPDKSLVGIYE